MTKAPNAFGLYDMHGSVWEWLWDRLGEYPNRTATNPRGSAGGDACFERRKLVYFPSACRSAHRGTSGPENDLGDYGARFARSVP